MLGESTHVALRPLEGGGGRIALGDPNQIETGREATSLATKRLAYESLDAVAVHGLADLARNRDPKAGGRQLRFARLQQAAGCHEHEEVPGVVLLTVPLNAKELRTPT